MAYGVLVLVLGTLRAAAGLIGGPGGLGVSLGCRVGSGTLRVEAGVTIDMVLVGVARLVNSSWSSSKVE